MRCILPLLERYLKKPKGSPSKNCRAPKKNHRNPKKEHGNPKKNHKQTLNNLGFDPSAILEGRGEVSTSWLQLFAQSL